MVEWYRADAPLEALADDCEALLRVAAVAAGRDPGGARGSAAPFARTTVRELWARHAGIELARRRGRGGAAREGGRRPASRSATRDGLGRHLLPGVPRPHRTAARRGRADVRVRLAGAAGRAGARRSPATRAWSSASSSTPGGLELANAFGELTDPVEQRRRFEDEARIRAARGKAGLSRSTRRCWRPCPDMPPTAGIALGFDRLVDARAGRARTSPTWSPSGTNAERMSP